MNNKQRKKILFLRQKWSTFERMGTHEEKHSSVRSVQTEAIRSPAEAAVNLNLQDFLHRNTLQPPDRIEILEEYL